MSEPIFGATFAPADVQEDAQRLANELADYCHRSASATIPIQNAEALRSHELASSAICMAFQCLLMAPRVQHLIADQAAMSFGAAMGSVCADIDHGNVRDLLASFAYGLAQGAAILPDEPAAGGVQ